MKTFTLANCAIDCSVLLSVSARAAEEFDAAAASRMLAPFVERDTIAVVHIDFARVNAKPLLALLARIVPDQSDDLTRGGDAATMVIELIRRAGVSDVYAVATLGGKGMIPQAFLVVPDNPRLDVSALRLLYRGGPREGENGVHSYGPLPQWDRAGGAVRKVGDAYVLPISTVPGLPPVPEKFHPAERPELREALMAAGNAAVQVAFIPPDSTRRVIEEIMPQMPVEIGGGPSTVLTHGISWAAAAIDLSPMVAARITIKSQDAAAAETLRTRWLDGMKLAGAQKEIRQALPEFDKVTALLSPKLSGDRLTLAVDEKDVAAAGLFAPMSQAVEKARESQCAGRRR